MHRFASLSVLAVFLALALCGCRVAGAIGESLPASEGYVNDLHEGQDKALAQVREDVGGAVEKLRSDHDAALEDLRTHVDHADAKTRDDAVAADINAAERFKGLLAEGKSASEAIAIAAAGKADEATRDAAAARAAADTIAKDTLATAEQLRKDALAQSKAQTEIALSEQSKVIAVATKKADEAKDAVAAAIEGAPTDLEAWGKAGGGILVTLLLSYLGLRRYDSKPFIGPNGEPIAEADLVKVARAQLAAAATPAKATG